MDKQIYNQDNFTENQKNEKKKKYIILIIFILLLMFASVGFGMYLYRIIIPQTVNYSPSINVLEIDPNIVDLDSTQSSNSPLESSGIVIPGFSEVTIPAKQSKVSMLFINPEDNQGKYYLSFELILKESGESIYTSKLVPPGKAIAEVNLEKTLDVGDYNAIVRVQPYRFNSYEKTNNADLETVLHVK